MFNNQAPFKTRSQDQIFSHFVLFLACELYSIESFLEVNFQKTCCVGMLSCPFLHPAMPPKAINMCGVQNHLFRLIVFV